MTMEPARLYILGEAVCKDGTKLAKKIFLEHMPGYVGGEDTADWDGGMLAMPIGWPTQDEIEARYKASPIVVVDRRYRTDIDVSLFVDGDPKAVLLAAMRPWFDEWAHDPDATWEPKGYYVRRWPTLVVWRDFEACAPPVVRLAARIMILAKNPDYVPTEEQVTP